MNIVFFVVVENFQLVHKNKYTIKIYEIYGMSLNVVS